MIFPPPQMSLVTSDLSPATDNFPGHSGAWGNIVSVTNYGDVSIDTVFIALQVCSVLGFFVYTVDRSPGKRQTPRQMSSKLCQGSMGERAGISQDGICKGKSEQGPRWCGTVLLKLT
jgi:hypothetical protein